MNKELRTNVISNTCMGFLIFICVIGISWLFFARNIDLANSIISMFMKGIMDKVKSPDDLTFSLIFVNNVKACIFIILLGIIPFIFYPVIALFINGAAIGAVGAIYMASTPDANFLNFSLGILPHGVLEIPAVLISFGCGYLICMEITKKLLSKGHISIKRVVFYALKTYVLVVIPLLLVAALIEANITPLLISK